MVGKVRVGASGFSYKEWRGVLDYGDEALGEWARRLRGFAEEATEIYVYFKHEAAAPELARRLSQLIEAGAYPR